MEQGDPCTPAELSALVEHEAEALREANRARADGATPARVRELVSAAERLRARINQVQRRLRDQQTH